MRARPLLLCLGLALVAPAVRAAPHPRATVTEDAAVDEAAKARYQEGVRLYKKKRYEEARVAFLQATALKKRPAATLMLGQCSLKSGRWLDAIRGFDAYVAEVGTVPDNAREIVENGRREARAHLGRIRFEVPEGAEVTLDGERVASPEVPIDVMPGSHAVVVTHREDRKTESVEATAGAVTEVKPSFAPKALVPTADTRTRPTLPPASEPTAEGGPERTSILSPPATTWPVYVAGAIGLSGLAAAAIFGGLQANSAHAVEVSTQTLVREKQSPEGCAGGIPGPEGNPKAYEETCLTLLRNQELVRSHGSAFGTALLVGLSGTALAAGWFFFAPKERGETPKRDGRAEPPRLTPWLGTTGAGATFQGRF